MQDSGTDFPGRAFEKVLIAAVLCMCLAFSVHIFHQLHKIFGSMNESEIVGEKSHVGIPLLFDEKRAGMLVKHGPLEGL
jgi:hypothetical protein